MLIPVRCFTCGALVADKYEAFKRRVDEGEDPGKALDELNVKRYCCRRMILSNVDVIDQMLPYYEAIERLGRQVRGEPTETQG
jgi:DNA-directed RNA polymerase subunit N